MSTVSLNPTAILSPCIGICSLGPNGLCEGCWRSGDEIAAWSTMSDAQRRFVMDHLLPMREAGGA